MQIKALIAKLQDLYDSYDEDYKNVMGEPEIVIDTFGRIGDTHQFEYLGYDNKIVIEKTDCGTYDILNAFYEDSETKTQKPSGSAWPFP